MDRIYKYNFPRRSTDRESIAHVLIIRLKPLTSNGAKRHHSLCVVIIIGSIIKILQQFLDYFELFRYFHLLSTWMGCGTAALGCFKIFLAFVDSSF